MTFAPELGQTILCQLRRRRKLFEEGDEENNSNVGKKMRIDEEDNSCFDDIDSNNNNNRCTDERLQIETEFKILQSLIPGVSKQDHVSELEIIDACVAYIERLQHQLYLRLNSTTQQQQLQQQQQIHQHQVDLAGRTVARRSSGRGETFRQQTTRLHRNFLTTRQNLRLR